MDLVLTKEGQKLSQSPSLLAVLHGDKVVDRAWLSGLHISFHFPSIKTAAAALSLSCTGALTVSIEDKTLY